VNYERLFLDHLGVVEQLVRFVARRQRLTPEEAEELSSTISLKLVENDYQIFRQFEGRSSLKTYLAAVIHRAALDARIARWGKWRPSAQARRLGPVATLLDRLLGRDGMPLDDAISLLRSQGIEESPDHLRAIAAQLPIRTRRRLVGEDGLDQLPDPTPAAQMVEPAIEIASEAEKVEEALAAALAGLPDVDRLILKMRFQNELPVLRIAQLLAIEPKAMYRRIDKVMKILRTELEARGVGAAQVNGLIGHPAMPLRSLMEEDAAETDPARPSIR
jgi:RNA polymerase sigma factor for flagellar operon FliA